jgi:hypothetical protein
MGHWFAHEAELPLGRSLRKQHALSWAKACLSSLPHLCSLNVARAYENWDAEQEQPMLDALQYYGAASGVLAALLIAMNLGRRWTGYAFIIFVTSSISLILWGFLQKDSSGIGLQKIALLIINAFGVYQHLRPREEE